MDSEQFWDEFDLYTNDTDRINFLLEQKDVGFPYELESQPNALLQRFFRVDYIDNTHLDATIIAKTFVKLFGKLIICRESTFSENTPITIIDDIEYCNSHRYNYRINSLYKALINEGVYNAANYNQLDVYKAYQKCNDYYNSENINTIFPIHNSIVKIQKWYKRMKLMTKLWSAIDVIVQEQMKPNGKYMQEYIKTL
jgi:hypothetical protein